ncbi:MAG: hypothetical protein ACP5NL_03600 [Thermoplasmata archaeon]
MPYDTVLKKRQDHDLECWLIVDRDANVAINIKDGSRTDTIPP